MFDTINLIEMLIIPLGTFLLWLAGKALSVWQNKVETETLESGTRNMQQVAFAIVQYTFQTVIKPFWEQFKANPTKDNESNYRQSLINAKDLAVSIIKDHLKKLPKALAEKLTPRAEEFIEAAIPVAKSENTKK